MDLKALGESIAKIGLPILGAALPIPGGAAIGTALASYIGSPSANPEDILATLKTSSDAMEKARQFELTHQETMFKLALDYQASSEQQQAGVINTEAKGDSWLQRSWRPLMMLWFGALLGLYWFGVQPTNLSQDTLLSLFGLLKVGIGGYIGGRSVEKITKSIPDVVKAIKG